MTTVSGAATGKRRGGRVWMADRFRVKQGKTLQCQCVSCCSCANSTALGIDDATTHLGVPQRKSLQVWWLSVLSTCLLTSCVVLPPSAAPPAVLPPLLSIAKVTPSQLVPFKISEPHKGQDFRIESVTAQSIDPSSLHYYWYFDWIDSNPVLDISAVCQSKSTCTVVLCDRPGNGTDRHTLLAVVSSAAQLDTAVTPTDFPPDTVYATVEWQIDNKGSCGQ